MKILVVDDNQDAAVSLHELLSLQGHEVEIALNGLEALQCYSDHPVQLVLMDIKMPVMDGIEATRRLLEIDSKARIVMVTGNTVKEDLRTATDMGIAGIIRKPFDAGELFALIETEHSRLGTAGCL